MDDFQFSLSHRAKLDDYIIGQFDALVSREDMREKDNATFPEYIRIERNNQFGLFKTIKAYQYRETIFINPKALPGTDGNDIVNIAAVTKTEFLWYKHRHDGSLKWAKWGLLLAATGVAIDSAIGMGKIQGLVLLHVSSLWMGVSMAAAMVCKIAGLVLVYVKGIKEAK